MYKEAGERDASAARQSSEGSAGAAGLRSCWVRGEAIFGGGKLVRVYDWETAWNVDAPRAEVFRALNAPAEQAEQTDNWWPSMVVERSEPLPDIPDCHIVIYRVIQAPNVRRFAPPLVIRSVTADVERDRRMRAVVTGDLAGVLETLLYDRPDGGTRVVFHRIGAFIPRL